jgi:G:T-mismatch repair DNA endonuclease (very short patch repair protein)
MSGLINKEHRKIYDELRRIVEDTFLCYFIDITRNEKNEKILSLDRRFQFLPLDAFADLVRISYERGSQIHKVKKNKELKVKPTKPEIIINQILADLNSGFVFNDHNKNKSKITIGTKHPDFIHINNKLIIEHFGEHWHGTKIRSKKGDIKTNQEHEIDKIQYFSKFGYKTLVIWEWELKDMDILKKKIENFIGIV